MTHFQCLMLLIVMIANNMYKNFTQYHINQAFVSIQALPIHSADNSNIRHQHFNRCKENRHKVSKQ